MGSPLSRRNDLDRVEALRAEYRDHGEAGVLAPVPRDLLVAKSEARAARSGGSEALTSTAGLGGGSHDVAARNPDAVSLETSAATASTASYGAWTAPVARQKIASPSYIVCAGRMARAIPSCATVATRLACSLVSSASVTTTPIVVLVPGTSLDARSQEVNAATHWWRSSSHIPPTLLTTITAATVARSAFAPMIPRPPGRICEASPPFATLAPVPAPTAPTAGCLVAAAQAAYPAARSGRALGSPMGRSKITAPATIGTRTDATS